MNAEHASTESARSQLIAHRSQLPMNGRIFFWSLTSALAGFLFGFDTVVISGAEKTIQALWGLTPGVHGSPWRRPSMARWWALCWVAGPRTALGAKLRCSGSAFSIFGCSRLRVGSQC